MASEGNVTWYGDHPDFPPQEARGPTPGIRIQGLTKRFGRATALDHVSLDIAAGEFFVVLGPSGCGKSTLLRLIAGLEQADYGEIHLGDTCVAGETIDLPPEARRVAVVFQSYALWPHLSVRKNVAFPAEAAGKSSDDVDRIVGGALSAVALDAFSGRRPASLSGGQQQRVALARCLASEAETVLMDEPLANLDVHLRAAMEEELMRVHKASGATTLYITHDQREAMALATRVAVMQAGRILQVAPPRTLYDCPANAEVAGFIGRATLLDCVVEAVAGETARVTVGEHVLTARCAATTKTGPARLVVRPSDVVLDPHGRFIATSWRTAYRGGHFELELEVAGLPGIVAQSHAPPSGVARFDIGGGWVLPPPGAAPSH
ncbi:MAG: ABC transporter ATP-binding protein [Pseudomonadota bacterium]